MDNKDFLNDEKINAPDGIYHAAYTGYLMQIKHEGKIIKIKTNIGVRGFVFLNVEVKNGFINKL